jgi:O-antigen/teichoic acid export membrane protein
MDLARTSVWALLYRNGALSFWVVIGVITARALSVDDRGSYSTSVTVIAGLGGIGASFAASSGYFVSNQKRAAAEVASNTMMLSAVVSVGLLVVSIVVASVLHGEARFLAMLVGLAMFPGVARSGIAGIFLATDELGRYSVAAYSPPAAGAVTVTVWVVLMQHRTAEAALAAWVAGQYLSLALAVAIGWRWWWWMREHRPDFELMRRILRFGAMIGVVSSVGLVSARIGQLLVIGIDGRNGAGIYASATALGEGVLFFAAAVATASYGQIGSLPRAEAGALTARAVRHATMVSVVLAAVLFALAPILITVLFGERYASATGSLRVLSIGALVVAPYIVLVNYFTVQLGRPHLLLWLTIFSSVLNIGMCLLLIPRIGYLGAAWAATVSHGLASVAAIGIFLATSSARPRDLWRIEWEDIAGYLRLADQIIRTRRFAPKLAATPAPAAEQD